MKNLYNITKGQLITLWVFGAFAWLYTLEYEGYVSLFLLIPFLLVFYTIGWRNNRKQNQ